MIRSGGWRPGFVLLLAVVALGAGEAPAHAKAKTATFEGACTLQGTVRFSPPATNAQQPLDVRYLATGTCSGTLNGEPIATVPVTVRQQVREVDGSCMRAKTTQPGRGTMTFADGTAIRYGFEFDFPVGAAGTFTFRGERSGSAHGSGSFVTDRTPPDAAMQCAGEGASELPLDATLVTDSPLVSGGGRHPSADRPQQRTGQRANTFTGSCEFSGWVAFHPPLTNDPQSISQRARTPGTCSGTFVDRGGRTHQLSDAPATFSESSSAESATCVGGTATGQGVLQFEHGQIRFAFSEARASGAAVVSASGRESGSASGVATVSQEEDPVAIANRCAGSGLKRVKIDAQMTTTPSISG